MKINLTPLIIAESFKDILTSLAGLFGISTALADSPYVGNDVVYAGDGADYVQSYGGIDW